MSRIALVVRRVGGLEETDIESRLASIVVRRVGGLEDSPAVQKAVDRVVRRVGGLEESRDSRARPVLVVRRVGGLEGLIEESFIMGFPFLTRRRWNGRNGRSRNSPL